MKNPIRQYNNPAGAGLLSAALLVTLTAFGPRAFCALPAHSISAGNLVVVQNDEGNLTNSISVSLSLSINDFRTRGTGGADADGLAPLQSRGDYPVQIGPDATNNFAQGILMSSVTQNGRDNGESGVNAGTNFCVSMIESQRLRTNVFDPGIILGAYFIPVNNANNTGAGGSDEYNINVAGAWFPYTNFYGGLARNSGDADGLSPTNNGVLNQFLGTPGLALGTHFIDQGNGRSQVILTNLGIDSRRDGVLLVAGGKNESANFALSQVNTNDGTWNTFIKDNGATVADNFEPDPIAFVFIPKTNTTVVSGRFKGNASIDMFSGTSPQFTVTSNGIGTYELKVPGRTPANGVLIISAEGGGTANLDNMVSYEANLAGDGWIIQSRDTAGHGLESIPANDGVVSFVYIPGSTPGIGVIPTNNLLTTESGGTANFNVVLHTQPTDDVTIPVSSSNTGEGTVSTSSLTFTTNNWNVPQTVTITGQNDALLDGPVGYTITLGAATSTDLNYNGINPDDVSVVNADNEVGITVFPTSALQTTEAGGTATFAVHLNTQPTADVTIGISSSNTGEGTVSASSLTFNNVNYATDQIVTITGVNDNVDDGNIAYTITTAAASSADGAYNGINPPDVSVVNIDNDTAGVVISQGLNRMNVTEGKTNGYTVVLTSQPTANVTVNVTSGNTAQGGTVTPSSLTFTPGNWNVAQGIKVTGTDDLLVDGNTGWFITNAISSSDPLYAALGSTLVSVLTIDNEIQLTLPSGDLVYGVGLAGVGLDGVASIVDLSGGTWDTGTLTVKITNNAASSDRIEIRNTGTGTGQIGVSGSTVTYEGTPIGTFTGGIGTTQLVVTFNGSASVTSAQALLRNVTYRNVTVLPSLPTRRATVTVAHPDVGASTAALNIRVSLLRYADFQEGADRGYGPYTGEADTQIREASQTTPWPAGNSASGLFIDYPDEGGNNWSQVLLRFDNIFGTDFGQVPTNAVIVSADLYLRINDQGDGSPLYRMLNTWDATNGTWNNLGNGDGIDQDDQESASTFTSAFGLANGDANTTENGAIVFSVTPDIQAWLSGATNFGWVMPGWFTNRDGTGFSPGETNIVTDRPRMRILWLPNGTPSTALRQGVNGYTNTVDTRIRANAPDTQFSTVTGVFVDYGVTGTTDNEQVLIRFDNMIGDGPNQVPFGATVQAAILDLSATIGNAMGDGGHFHMMLKPWFATNTWNQLTNGITADDIEAVAANSAVAGVSNLNPNVQAGYLQYELTSDVQTWVSGIRPNYGWAILPWVGGTDGWGFGTSKAALASDRPRLRVFYTAIVITSITRNPSNAVIQFKSQPNQLCTILRASTVTGTYSSIGTATTAADGTASFTDNSPPAGAAFYRISFP